MRIQSATFLKSAPNLESCPAPGLPEFAFIGRSNVGKSSLLNMLSGKKDLAKVSGNPGHTRLINYFLMNEKWHLVDLPGYGYAKTSKTDREAFQMMIADYLANREGLTCVFVLIDSRHSPQAIDLEFVQWLMEGGIPFVLVFTKTDKLKNSRVDKHMEAFSLAMGPWCEVLPRTFKSSAEKGEGRKEILGFIGEMVG